MDAAHDMVHLSRSEIVTRLPANWMRAADFEAIAARHRYHERIAAGDIVVFIFGVATRLLADAGLWLLSFLNQLDHHAQTCGAGGVRLEFEADGPLFGYLDRSGFLKLLSASIRTDPERPELSGADVHRGRAGTLVEIAEIHPNTTGRARQAIVTDLTDKLALNLSTPSRARAEQAVFGALAELVNNVFEHSHTPVSGYAMLQAYQKTGRIQIAVSDSGIGIPRSLREQGRLPGNLSRRTDGELILRAIRRGLSRHGEHSGHGCGLRLCGDLTERFTGQLLVRTPSTQVTYRPRMASAGPVEFIEAPTGVLAGTHVCIELRA